MGLCELGVYRGLRRLGVFMPMWIRRLQRLMWIRRLEVYALFNKKNNTFYIAMNNLHQIVKSIGIATSPAHTYTHTYMRMHTHAHTHTRAFGPTNRFIYLEI